MGNIKLRIEKLEKKANISKDKQDPLVYAQAEKIKKDLIDRIEKRALIERCGSDRYLAMSKEEIVEMKITMKREEKERREGLSESEKRSEKLRLDKIHKRIKEIIAEARK